MTTRNFAMLSYDLGLINPFLGISSGKVSKGEKIYKLFTICHVKKRKGVRTEALIQVKIRAYFMLYYKLPISTMFQ